ncbi:hypothetical protein ABT352_32890 [Streptosporangium sp. NPDC000563]|uniref:hypothetical protein n=1 Tax=Streptosporangium sp. NPDC000563 TaxID=3154366 RepID=UPI00331C7067
MGLHLAAIRLAQLSTPPAAPPPGEVVFYAGADGRLYRRPASGAAVVVSPNASAVLPADTVVTEDTRADVPGLGIGVTPGSYQLSGTIWATIDPGMWGTAWVGAPAGTRLTATYDLATTGDFGDGSDFGQLTGTDSSFAFAYPHARTAAVVLSGGIVVTEPGTVRLQAAHSRNALARAFDEEFGNLNEEAGCVYEWVDDIGHTAPGAVRVTPDDSGDDVIAGLSTQGGDIEAGAYQASAWLYSPMGWGQAGITITWWSNFDEELGSESEVTAIAAGTWTEYVINAAAPEGAYRATLRVVMLGAPTGEDVLYFDDVAIDSVGSQLTLAQGSFFCLTRI